jgi:aminopeptidase N
VTDQHIVLPSGVLHEGEIAITIAFEAGDGSLNRNEEFLYTLFVPDRARTAFPTFDQPNLKARYRLTLEVPEDWEAVGNAEILEQETVGDRKHVTFDETEPISTYLFAFAAGRFAMETAERDGRRLRLYHRETDAEKLARNLDAIFDLHATALSWLEEYTDTPYPFGKFDFVAVPSFQYGGMEHPGSILYRSASLFLDESATQSQH